MTKEEFAALDMRAAQTALLAMSVSARPPFVSAYKQARGIDLTISPHQESAVGAMSGIAWLLIIGGVLCSVGAFYYDVGIAVAGSYGMGDRVANVDRIAIRNMILACGLTSVVSGWVLVAAGLVVKALRQRL
ncbi:hypothetical protein [Brevundimonas naejangsanensis]|uniref:hypothetical protein n=1 Tax=Brevundimonas naejangsanensis TaxID=588932 RepID=UPI0034D76EA9